MGVDIGGFYDENAEPSGDFSPIPAGSYYAEIVESEIADISRNNANMGRCLVLSWKVTRGDLAGRLVWQRINLWPGEDMKNSGKVKEIGNAQFAAIRKATGKTVVQNTDELHFIECAISVKVKADPGYNPRNEIGGVNPANGNGAAATAPAGRPSGNAGAATAPSSAPRASSPEPAMAGGDGGRKRNPWDRPPIG